MERIILDNAKTRKRKPIVEEWSIRFETEMTRADIVRRLIIFLDNPNIKKFMVGGFCRLVGTVRDCEGLDNGTSIITANIDSFRRVKTGQYGGYPYYLICVTFETGNKCYIYDDCFTRNMAELFKYYERGGVTKPAPKFINEFSPYVAYLT